MAWSNNGSGKAAKTERNHPLNKVTDLLLYCFEQRQKQGSNYVILSCKIHAGKLPDGNYAPHIPVTVMCCISGQQDKLTDIAEGDYSKKWIHVDGQISTDTYQKKDGSYTTTLQVWATKVVQGDA